MKKILPILLALMLSAIGSYAADTTKVFQLDELISPQSEEPEVLFNKHNISVYGIGGISTLLYSTTYDDNSTVGFGGGGGVGYSVNFIPQFGIYIGIEALPLQSTLISENLPPEPSPSGLPFSYVISKLKARQTTIYISIPFLLQSQLRLSDNYQFFMDFGIKVGYALPTQGQSGTSIEGGITYNDGNTAGIGDPSSPFYFEQSVSRRRKFNLNFAFSADAGIRRKITDRLYLYAGVFADYGVFDVRDDLNDAKFLAKEEAGKITSANDIFASSYIKGMTHNFAFGGKIRFDIDVQQLNILCKKNREARKKAREERKRMEEESKLLAEAEKLNGDSRLTVSVRDAMTQKILVSNIIINNRANIKDEVHDSILTKAEDNVYRLNLKSQGDYLAVVNVEVPEDLKRALMVPDSIADTPPQAATKEIKLEKGNSRVRLMVRDIMTERLLQASVKVLDSKTLMFVDVLAQLNADGSYSVNVPSEFNGYLTFNVGGRSVASHIEAMNNATDKDNEEGNDNVDKIKRRARTTNVTHTRRTVRRSGTTAEHRIATTPQGTSGTTTTYVVASSNNAPTGSTIGRLFDQLGATFSDCTIRIRRFFVGGEVRHQVEIQAIQ
jgi:hypothetical protein